VIDSVPLLCFLCSGARAEYARSLVSAEQLVATDPKSVRWKAEVAEIRAKLASCCTQLKSGR